METVLNQEEIDAMVQAAHGAPAGSESRTAAEVELWDIHRASQIGRDQLQAITLLHEGFARNLTHALGAYLRVVFAATLVSAEHLSYGEFLRRMPETTYLASCKLGPMGANAALQLDLKVAFPVIDLLLGGEGRGLASNREITEIEEQILDSVSGIVCRELAGAWQALGLEVVFERRLEAGAARRLMPPDEKTLSLSFEVTMPDARGGLNLALPAVVSNALLRKISAEWSYQRPRTTTDSRARLKRRLLECTWPVELAANKVCAPLGSLTTLAPGSLLTFSRSAAEPASLLISGLEMFRAFPARCRDVRAARVLERFEAGYGERKAQEDAK